MKKKHKYYCPECKKTFNELAISQNEIHIKGILGKPAKYKSKEVYEYCPHCWGKKWRYNGNNKI